VSSFCPDGYLPSQTAIAEAGEYWFSDRLAEIETAAAARAAKRDEPKTGLDALAWALSQPPIPEAAREIYTDIWQPTEDRLRRLLHQGERLTAYYFGGLFSQGRNAIPPEFWATAAADGVLTLGHYFPFGKPNRSYERRLSCPIFFLKAELAALLSEEQGAKRQLPESKKPELVAALIDLNHLPSRTEQFKALRDMPQFRDYRITDAVLREATKKAPLPLGRRRKQQSD
jgi:hypothetical protein